MTLKEITRDQILEEFFLLKLDWGDQEDAVDLVDLLLRKYEPIEAFTWLYFYQPELDGIPMDLLKDGHVREVLIKARRMVGT